VGRSRARGGVGSCGVAKGDGWRRGRVLWLLFLPAGNLLLPVGTNHGERLAYLPSTALAVLAGLALMAAGRRFGSRVAWGRCSRDRAGVRRAHACDLDWRDPGVFYASWSPPRGERQRATTSSARTSRRGGRCGGRGGVRSGDRDFPGLQRGLPQPGKRAGAARRTGEAAESYRNVLRFDPGHQGARRTWPRSRGASRSIRPGSACSGVPSSGFITVSRGPGRRCAPVMEPALIHAAAAGHAGVRAAAAGVTGRHRRGLAGDGGRRQRPRAVSRRARCGTTGRRASPPRA